MMRKNEKRHSYWAYFRPHVWQIMLAFILTTMATSGSFASTHLLSQFVDRISALNFNNIAVLVGSILFIEVLSKGMSRISAEILLRRKAKIITELRFGLLRRISESSVGSITANDPVALAETSSVDANILIDAVQGIYGEIFNLVMGIAALIYIVVVSWQMAALLAIAFIIILLVQYFAVKRMVMSNKEARRASVSAKTLLVQAIEAFEDFKVQGLRIKPHVANSLESEVQKNAKAEKVVLNNKLLSEVLASFVQCLFLALSVLLILTSSLDLGGFVAIFMYKGYVFSLVGAILRIARYRSQATTAKERMDAILNSEIVSKERWGTVRLKNPSGKIVIKDLVVKYGETLVIDNLSLELPEGKFVGIVGESGCGKSTILKVLAKAVTPTSGSIQMDGVELADLTETSYRRAITLAPQTPFLFDFTIKQNMLLANPKASDEEIWDCLKQCAADQFVHEKGGLDAVITPKELSGGQRQRLALARIALRGGKIILLDEATSALDGESQAIVLESIRKAADMGHTMVLVAHRVTSLKAADVIFVMEDGKVLETGTYDELYNTSEKFRRLANLG